MLQERWVRRLRDVDANAGLRFNYDLGRWEFMLSSADGVIRSQFWGWYVNPLTGEPIPADPATGLQPFRDLDDAAIEEACANLTKTFIGNPHDGAGTTRREVERRIRFNAEHRRKKYKAAGDLWADMFLDRLPRMRGTVQVQVLGADGLPARKPEPAKPKKREKAA